MKYQELKEKYPLAYAELARLNTEVGKYSHKNLDNAISTSVKWTKTPQGDNFWRQLCRKDINNCKKLHPELFEVESKPKSLSDVDPEVLQRAVSGIYYEPREYKKYSTDALRILALS